MEIPYYLNLFTKAEEMLDKYKLNQRQVKSSVVLYGKDCVVLKLYKLSWANPSQDPLSSASRIFFSIWVSPSSLKEQKLLYNIHALKLRDLKNYSIQSKKFAEIFRNSFKAFESKWDNVRVDFGPLTLMEGWKEIEPENLVNDIIGLSHKFLEIEPIVEATLERFKKA